MEPRDFCYWLSGVLAITGSNSLSEEAVAEIRKKLSGVFEHYIDKQYDVDQETAQSIHDGFQTNIGDSPQIGGTDSQGNVYRC
jgi:hypothetical protein